MGMAVTLGGVSSALVAFGGDDADDAEPQLISRKTIDIISCIYAPLSIVMMCYALFTFHWRSKFMRTKQVRERGRGEQFLTCWDERTRVQRAVPRTEHGVLRLDL